MSYRDELEAAHRRAAALEAQVRELSEEIEGKDQRIAQLDQRIARLEDELERRPAPPKPKRTPKSGPKPRPKRTPAARGTGHPFFAGFGKQRVLTTIGLIAVGIVPVTAAVVWPVLSTSVFEHQAAWGWVSLFGFISTLVLFVPAMLGHWLLDGGVWKRMPFALRAFLFAMWLGIAALVVGTNPKF